MNHPKEKVKLPSLIGSRRCSNTVLECSSMAAFGYSEIARKFSSGLRSASRVTNVWRPKRVGFLDCLPVRSIRMLWVFNSPETARALNRPQSQARTVSLRSNK